MTETWYISGPMRGLPDFNYPLFNKVAEELRSLRGIEVLNPAENFGGDTSREAADYMRLDIDMLLKSDVIFMLPGWQDSEGARLEYMIANILGLEVEYYGGASATEPAEMVAARIVRNGERQAAYGHPNDDFRRTASMWSATFGQDVPPEKVAIAMIQLKLSRLIGNLQHRDSLVDAIGYLICLERILEVEK